MTTQWNQVNTASWYGHDCTKPAWKNLPIDPYLVWAAVTGFVDAGGQPAKWAAVSLELTRPISEFLKTLRQYPNSSQWIQIDGLYSAAAANLADSKYCTAIISEKFFTEFPPALQQCVSRFEVVFALAPESFVNNVPLAFTAGVSPVDTPADVPCVIGIIDDGIAFAHEKFREKSGKTTRIDYLWDQGYFSRDFASTGYGTEHSQKDINKLMSSATSATGDIDEDAVYNMAGYDEVRRRFAHGTFVLDVAAGCKPAEVDKTTPRIVAVQLQSASRRTRDRACGWLGARTLDGLRYILDRATKIKKNVTPPVIVNLSYGLSAGAHDGSSILEKAMDELITLGKKNAGIPLAIVIAAGNSNLRRRHAEFDLENGDSKKLLWRALPDDPTPNFMEIWLPKDKKGGAPKIDVEVTTPTGDKPIKPIAMGETYAWYSGTTPLCVVSSNLTVATGDRAMVLIALAPSKRFNATQASAPPGTWSIKITSKYNPAQKIHAWLQYDETPFTFPQFGRQSRFFDPAYKLYDEVGHMLDTDPDPPTCGTTQKYYVHRRNTLNSIATGLDTITVGGYRNSDGIAARYSSSGPKLDSSGKDFPPLCAPAAVAVSDDTPSQHGILAAGSRSGSTVAINGTSVAAPQVVRLLSKGISSGSMSTANAIANIVAEATSRESSPLPINYPKASNPIRFGAGRLKKEFGRIRRDA